MLKLDNSQCLCHVGVIASTVSGRAEEKPHWDCVRGSVERKEVKLNVEHYVEDLGVKIFSKIRRVVEGGGGV